MGNQVFLCHNSRDKAVVREIRDLLEHARVNTWIDEKNIPLGVPWFKHIFNHIDDFSTAIVFLGPFGVGAVQEQEIVQVLTEFEKAGKRVIPLLLPGFHEEKPPLPHYIATQLVAKWNYIDLSLDPPGALRRLVAELVPNHVAIDQVLDATVAHLPKISPAKRLEQSFVASWVLLHLIGFAGITFLVRYRSALQWPKLTTLAFTSAVMVLLLLPAWRQLTLRRIRLDYDGIAAGSLTACFLSFGLVTLASDPDGYIRAIGALATTVAFGAISANSPAGSEALVAPC